MVGTFKNINFDFDFDFDLVYSSLACKLGRVSLYASHMSNTTSPIPWHLPQKSNESHAIVTLIPCHES